MKTTFAQLQAWLAEPEGANLEFKEARRRFHFEKLLKYAVALANEGGKIIFKPPLNHQEERCTGYSIYKPAFQAKQGRFYKSV